MKLLINENIIEVIYANNFKQRLIGLMGKKNIEKGMFFPHCNSIHTFFMKEEIDVLMLNKNNKIIYTYSNFKKNKVIYKRNCKKVIELPKNTINKHNIKVNNQIKIVN